MSHGDTAMELETLNRKPAADNEINWVTATFMALFHVGAIAALFFFTWKALFVAMFLWWVSGSLGIGMGYHRLLTHRGYRTPKWVEYVLTTCATLALEGGPIFWVATHRIHHQHSDQEGDPHTPLDGKWWAHMGWILMGKSMHHDTTTLARYVPDLATNNWWVAILTFGEGWHNNHHAHPVSARHGLKWYEVDVNWYGIWALKKLGLARHVYRVRLSELQRREEQGRSSAARRELVSV